MFSKLLLIAPLLLGAAYGQCDPEPEPETSSAVVKASPTHPSPSHPAPSSSVITSSIVVTSSAVSSPVAASSAAAAPSASPSASSSSGAAGASYKASFTEYGSTDDNGSGTCNTATAACGFYINPGYSAAASQNLFGVGPGAGAGPACGTCYQLTAETDSSGNRLSNAGNSIVVMVNNLCPAQGNPLCAQSSLSSTNQYGANVNFDLCIDDGASAALFGNSGVGLAVGTATEVSCAGHPFTIIH